MERRRINPSPFIIIIIVCASSSSFASPNPSPPIYESIVQCLRHHANDDNPHDHQEDITTIVFSPNNHSFNSILQAYLRNSRLNTSSTPKPSLILTPTRISHVRASVKCAGATNHRLRIRSGGHDYEGLSYAASSSSAFFLLDMSHLRSVRIGRGSGWVQAGATLGELYYAIWRKSRVQGFPAGMCPTVGVGGHVSGGGYGNLMRKYGLSVDNVVDAQVVDADGMLLDRKSMGEDLFWAIRGGGGGSFCVVIAYKIRLVRVPDRVTVFRVEKDLSGGATKTVHKWQFVAPKTTDDHFMRMLLQAVNSKSMKGKLTIRATILGQYLGNSERVVGLLGKEYPELGLKKEDCMEMSWIQSVLWWGLGGNETNPKALLDRKIGGQGRFLAADFLKRKSDYVQRPISKANLRLIWKKMIKLEGNVGLVFNPYGGRMDEIGSSETAFPHRAGNLFKIQYSASWKEARKTTKVLNQMRMLHSYMTPFVSKNPRRAYLNYRDLDIGTMGSGSSSSNIGDQTGKIKYEEGKVYGMKYFAENFDRLVKVKTAVDPRNFFWNEQSIPVLPM